MAKDIPPQDPHSSPEDGDSADPMREKITRSEETSEIEETTPLLPDEEREMLRHSAPEDLQKTVANTINATVPSIESTDALETIDLKSGLVGNQTMGDTGDETVALDSPLDERDVTRTINPRELSKEDAKAWENLTVGAISGLTKETGLRSEQKPAVERSFTETKLLIRDRNVTADKDDPSTPSDYRLVRLLGKGGMGNVYVAKQGSLDRLIAVKVIRPLEGKRREQLEKTGRLEAVEQDRRQQFLSEAVVTGDLDHPNIVPIHDIAVTSDNTLFYAMKRVVGTPWSKVIKEKTRDENLDILLKVCDAIGFAHTRGVVHRDIKPENIMLGDFGVVMVMDWGLALAQPEFEKIDSISHAAGLGGTPAFMAPEMATGPIAKIGPAADIYLLGATLFYIVVGQPPHHAENISQCLLAVKANEIHEVEPQYRGELLEIALKAMATRPEDRYADVRKFQAAIRQYRAHAESIALATHAIADLELARESRDYALFSRARFGFEQALSLWSGNDPAKQGLADTTIAHAMAAHDKQDFDLGLSLLDADDETHQTLIEKLQGGRRLRQQRASRLRLFKLIAAAMLAFILIGGSVAGYVINLKRNEAVEAKVFAEEQKLKAIEQKEEADRQKDNAREQERRAVAAKEETQETLDKLKVANTATEKALVKVTKAEAEAQQQREIAQHNEIVAVDAAAKEKAQRELAVLQTRRAEYETYLSQIGLAKARIESNEFDEARRTLNDVRRSRASQSGGLAWEWRWLWRQANESVALEKSTDALVDLALENSQDGFSSNGIAVLANGQLQRFAVNQDSDVKKSPVIQLPDGGAATAVAISKSNEEVAVGTTRGDIQLWDRQCKSLLRNLVGHESHVTRLHYVEDSVLISGSNDKTARVWNTKTGESLETCWHIAAVRDLAATRVGRDLLLVTATADSLTGRADVWSIRGEPLKANHLGEFAQHDASLASIAISPDGKTVVTGDVGGNLFTWPTSTATATNHARAIASAVKHLNAPTTVTSPQNRSKQTFDRMLDPASGTGQSHFVSATTTADAGRAHDGVIMSLRFSVDGKSLITASDDYTVKLWNAADLSLQKTLRGHGGWVTAASFIGDSHDEIVSISNDSTIRRWDANSYIGSSKQVDGSSMIRDHDVIAPQDGDVKAQAHNDEIWSARFDATGTRIVTASRDHSARVLEIDPDTMAFREIASMNHDDREDRLSEGTPFVAMSFAVDRDRGRLLIGSADACMRIWDIEKGNEIAQAVGTGLNSSFALSRDGTLLLTGASSSEDKATLWRLDTKGNDNPSAMWRVKQHDQAVTAFAISHDNTMFFTGDRNGLGYLWSVETGQPIGPPIEHVRGYRINAACFTLDNRQLLIAADDQQVSRIDIASRKLVGRLSHDGFVTQLSLSLDGTQAVTVSEMTTSKKIRTEATRWVLATEQGQRLHRIESDAKSSKDAARITMAQFGDQSRWIVVAIAAAGERPARVMRWDSSVSDLTSAKPTSLRLPNQLGTLQAAMPLGSQRMLTLNGDAAFLWDLESMTHIKSYRDHAAISQADFSHDGKYVVSASRSVKIWDTETGRSLGKIESPHDGFVRSVDFHPTKLELATGGEDGIAKRWSWDPVEQQFRLIDQLDVGKIDPALKKPVRRIKYSPEGASLLVAGTAGSARLWNLSKDHSDSFTSFDVPDAGDFTSVTFSADGNWMVLGSDDKVARMYRIGKEGSASTAPILFVGHADQIEDVAIIQDASNEMRVLTASRDKSARVWDPRIDSQDGMGREVIALRRHTQGVTAIDATDSGSLVMTAGRDGAVMLWPAGAAQASHQRR